MSINGDTASHAGFDGTDHQAAYIFAPSKAQDDLSAQHPKKRRKTGRTPTKSNIEAFQLAPLLNEEESSELSARRLELFKQYWTTTEGKIQNILNEANEGTLDEVTGFIQAEEGTDKVPAGFIVTGPNIASQDLLFGQLALRLSTEINGPIVTLRSGEASNLKMLLKKLIRDITNQRSHDEDDDGNFLEQDKGALILTDKGRKLLNYDLEIVNGYVKAHGCKRVVVSFQDSEAFDSGLLAEVISLFSSWLDRIPFLLLFGIATSVELFQERLPRAASRSLYGSQFDVEQTSSILEKIYQKVVAGPDAPMKLGPTFLSSLMERQNDHVQSVPAFIGALKYAYMCHFYANPLSIVLGMKEDCAIRSLLQPEHFEAIRMLPSFQKHVESLVEAGELKRAMGLMTKNENLAQEVENCILSKDETIQKSLRAMHIIMSSPIEVPGAIDLYMKASTGSVLESETFSAIIESLKRSTLEDFRAATQSYKAAAENGKPELDLEPWTEAEPEFYKEIADIYDSVSALAESEEGKSIRSSYSIHNKALRTTVISQKVQLSQEKSSLTKHDKEYTLLVDRLIKALQDFVFLGNLQDLFLSEVWIYDLKYPYQDAFTPKPRFAIERALSSPHEYLSCGCCDPTKEGASMSHPPTAILYKLFLEAGTLINVFDLWTAFVANLGPEYDEGDDSERRALMLFYRGLADLKLLGMVKQSRKKTDHLTKMTWKGFCETYERVEGEGHRFEFIG
ncbi:origin recognition complex subunit protein [Rutstroemia sp. NJR-2017a BBW]|nr:origin recognition complex subunit protein [Rutstroemia sp. NJR-2017a BBW]